MQSKEEILNAKFNWIGQTKRMAKSDVSINLVFYDKRSSSDKAFHFVFRNDAAKISDYVQIAIYKNRIMIRPSKEGFHLLKRKDGPGNKYLKVRETKDTENIRGFIGDYELKYDEFYDIYYIERDTQ